MTTTLAPPDVEIDSEIDTVAALARPDGFYGLVTTNDHKAVGRLWLIAGLLFLLAAVVLGVLIGVESFDSGSVDVFGGSNSYFAMETLYRMGFVLFAVVPLFIGLATLIVPLQIGANNVAFPRLSLAAFWTWLLGSVITAVAVLSGGGWGALDGVTGNERDAIELTLLGTIMVVVALLAASVSIATTVISNRTAGLTLRRAPLFSWSMLVACSVWLVTLPVFIANLLIAYIDLRGRIPIGPGQPTSALWDSLDWVLAQPQIFAFAIPVLGIVGDVVPVTMRIRQNLYPVLMGAIGAAGVLSVGAWSQTIPDDARLLFIAFGVGIVLPVLISLGGAVESVFRGRSTIKGLPPTAFMAAIAGLSFLLLATVVGAVRSTTLLDNNDGYADLGIFNAVMVASVLGVVGGVWYWNAKISGGLLSEGAGRLATLVVSLGGAVLVVPAMLVGLSVDRSDAIDSVSAVGSFIFAAGVLVVLAGAVSSLRPGHPAAGDDPFDGMTLEWATTSPPSFANFNSALPRVTSEYPLLDLRDEGEEN